MKHVTVTFDYEAAWGMPFEAPYDLDATTDRLLAVLTQARATAVFFVTGKLAEDYPQIITRIHAAGHEIGLHGYAHEHMHHLSAHELVELQRKFDASCEYIKGLTGYRPTGFRAPYLMGPKFYDHQVYEMLATLGFTWVSNREIRMPEELLRGKFAATGRTIFASRVVRQVVLLALNARLIAGERPAGGSAITTAKWLTSGAAPFKRAEGLMEYPLTSPLDCDLYGLPRPDQTSGPRLTAHAFDVLKSCYRASGSYFNINCHDWITGSADRTQALANVLAWTAADKDTRFYRPGLDGVVS